MNEPTEIEKMRERAIQADKQAADDNAAQEKAAAEPITRGYKIGNNALNQVLIDWGHDVRYTVLTVSEALDMAMRLRQFAQRASRAAKKK